MRRFRVGCAGIAALTVLVGCNLGTAPDLYPGPSRAVASADLNGDGTTDLVAGGTGGWVTLLSDGTGGFTTATTAADVDVRATALGDVDGDGVIDRVDVHRPDDGTSEVLLAPGDGAGGFGPSSVVTETAPDRGLNDVTLGDLDGDGDLDLVTTGAANAADIHVNDGTGAFAERVPTWGVCGLSPSGTWVLTGDDVEAVDVDDDGDLDLVTITACNDSFAWLVVQLNDGTGDVSSASFYSGSSGSRFSMQVLDADEDGHPDVLYGSPQSSTAQLRLGIDTSSVGTAEVAMPAPVQDLASGDIDGDGHVDVMSTAPGSGVANVLYGDGAAAFGDKRVLVTGGSTAESVIAADFDGDGRTDVALGFDNAGGSPQVALMPNSLDGR